MDDGATPSQRNALTALYVLGALIVVAAFLAGLFALVWWGTDHSQRARAEFARVHSARQAASPTPVQSVTSCIAGQGVDAGVCAPLFPAPLAFVGAIMDSRYSACDVSFERMMCGGWRGPSNQRALGYAASRFRRLALRALEQAADPLYRSCVGARGTPSARRETAIEYRHVVETLLGDLHIDADLPALWGRLARAGYQDSAGAPLTLHKRLGTWYLSAPTALVEWSHALSESRLFQLMQTGPVLYGAVELQQRMQLFIETTQALYHHLGSTGRDHLIAVPFGDLPQTWPWPLYLAGIAAPDPLELVVCDDLAFAEWVLSPQLARTLTVNNWRAWHEFHLGQAHGGHRSSGEQDNEDCLNLTLALAPELVNAALLRTVEPSDWHKIEVESAQLAARVLSGSRREVNILPGRVCEVAASMSPDRFDHNVNLVRAWRWSAEQVAPLQPSNALNVEWPLLNFPILRLGYGEVSKFAIFGAALHWQAQGRSNMSAALETLIPIAWEALPLTTDRQHFFMVWAQAYCDTPGIDVDAILRGNAAFRDTMGCHEGQGMY